MSDQAVSSSPVRNYTAFDAELTGKAFNLRLFARLLGWLKPYRVMMFTSVVFVVVSATLAVLMPVLTGRVVIDNILLQDPVSARMPDYGLTALTMWLSENIAVAPLVAAALMYMVMVLGQGATMYVHRLTLASSTLRALRDLRLDLFTSLERKPTSFYDHVSVGRVMTRVTNDIENLFELLTGFGMLVGEFVPFFVALFLMFHISGELTGVVLLAIPIAGIGTYFFRRAMRDIFRKIRNSVSKLNQYMQEDLIGIQVVQLSGRENLNESQYTELNRENRGYEYHAINYEQVYWAFNDSLASVAIGAIVWYGGGQVVQQEISLGSMILFTQLINMMIMPIVALGEQFNVLFRSMASGERIFQALDWDERIKEPKNPVQLPARLRGEIELRNCHFGYYPDDLVLKDVSFDIQPGQKLAIVGPTGSGKSTIIRLLARFYDFDDGMIFLDGIDVNKIRSHDLRKRIGVVLQDFHIFSGTVRDNITLHNPQITPEHAEWAAKVVNADRFIRQLPNGYDTELSERGQNLSQGQRQLLAFARVLAGDPEILVLDEATASIDTATELVIQDALHKLTEGRTSIIIAHRLQTIQECDNVLVLHHGVVQEYGTHDE
ncbi:MAG: ABC transporter ATP-binding protein, partial [Pseudomonadales bacterium]